MTGVETAVAVLAVLVAGVFVMLLRRPAQPDGGNVVELEQYRYGTVRHRRCEECGQLVEEHRMIHIGDGWFCVHVDECVLRQEGGA